MSILAQHYAGGEVESGCREGDIDIYIIVAMQRKQRGKGNRRGNIDVYIASIVEGNINGEAVKMSGAHGRRGVYGPA